MAINGTYSKLIESKKLKKVINDEIDFCKKMMKSYEEDIEEIQVTRRELLATPKKHARSLAVLDPEYGSLSEKEGMWRLTRQRYIGRIEALEFVLRNFTDYVENNLSS